MTDLTILIAVIALALWPLTFLLLRIRHERKKRRDHLDRMTKEDLEELIVILKRGMPKKQQDGSVLYEPSADSAEIIESLSEELRNAPNEEYIPIADYDPTFPCNVVFKTVWNKMFMCLPMKIK